MTFNIFLSARIVLFGYALVFLEFEIDAVIVQSKFTKSRAGFQFSPINYRALFLLESTLPSVKSCALKCHSNVQCRIFDYDGLSGRCRLFEGNQTTMGTIVNSPSSQSYVGVIQIESASFVNIDRPCSFCENNRKLKCIDNTCQCPERTYFDGVICQSKKIDAACTNNIECRDDLNYTCLLNRNCSNKQVQGYYIQSRLNGMVLDLNQGSTAQSTLVIKAYMTNIVNGCLSTQLWRFNSDGTIENVISGYVLDVQGSSQGTNLIIYAKHAGLNQQWRVDGLYIYCPDSNRAVDINSSNSASGTTVIAQPRLNTLDQEWNIIPYIC